VAGDLPSKLGVVELPGGDYVGMAEKSRATGCGSGLTLCVGEEFTIGGDEGRQAMLSHSAMDRAANG